MLVRPILILMVKKRKSEKVVHLVLDRRMDGFVKGWFW